jgi:hypothetical protein
MDDPYRPANPAQSWPTPYDARHPVPYPVQQTAPKAGRGLAITSLVLSAVALLGVLVVAALVLITGASAGPGTAGPGTGGPLTGQLSRAPSGDALPGATLATDVSHRITSDGGDVTRMDCPATARVAQGVVTVCHGAISGSDYAVVVYFEDRDGRFTLNAI